MSLSRTSIGSRDSTYHPPLGKNTALLSNMIKLRFRVFSFAVSTAAHGTRFVYGGRLNFTRGHERGRIDCIEVRWDVQPRYIWPETQCKKIPAFHQLNLSFYRSRQQWRVKPIVTVTSKTTLIEVVRCKSQRSEFTKVQVQIKTSPQLLEIFTFSVLTNRICLHETENCSKYQSLNHT